jgi:hypothetical protein
MIKKRLLTLLALLLVLAAGFWFYQTSYQKYLIRKKIYEVRDMLVAGNIDERLVMLYSDEIANSYGQAITPSVRKELGTYAGSFARTGDPELLIASIMVDQPYWKWANGLGLKHTLPSCIALLEKLDSYAAGSRQHLEFYIANILPQASKQSFGIEEGKFTQDPEKRKQAIVQWLEWYKLNKDRVLAENEEHMKNAEDQLREMRRELLQIKAAAQEFDIEIRPKKKD